MRSIATAVEHSMSQSPFLEELLALDIINLSELAREMSNSIEEQTQKQVTQGSIVMALKRLRQKTVKKNRLNSQVFNTMPELIVRSNLFEITVKNSPTLLEKQKKLLAFANRQQSNFATFTYGLFETTTIASYQVKAMALSLFVGEKVVSEIEDVATVTIKFPIDIVDSPFVYYTVLRTLAWAGISMTEIVSTYSELIIVLKNKDVELAFSLIKKLFSPRKALK